MRTRAQYGQVLEGDAVSIPFISVDALQTFPDDSRDIGRVTEMMMLLASASRYDSIVGTDFHGGYTGDEFRDDASARSAYQILRWPQIFTRPKMRARHRRFYHRHTRTDELTIHLRPNFSLVYCAEICF